MTNGWTGGQYSLCRATFGMFLFVHFVALLPWAAEVFSDRGVLPAAVSPFLRLFPNVLAVSDSPVHEAREPVVGRWHCARARLEQPARPANDCP
jgi:hypothetical protein